MCVYFLVVRVANILFFPFNYFPGEKIIYSNIGYLCILPWKPVWENYVVISIWNISAKKWKHSCELWRWFKNSVEKQFLGSRFTFLFLPVRFFLILQSFLRCLLWKFLKVWVACNFCVFKSFIYLLKFPAYRLGTFLILFLWTCSWDVLFPPSPFASALYDLKQWQLFYFSEGKCSLLQWLGGCLPELCFEQLFMRVELGPP